jgi:hypothetical protein
VPDSFPVAKHTLDCMQEWHTAGRVLGSEPWPESPALHLLGRTGMSIEAHLAELQRRHRDLEAEIAEARAHPSTDDLEMVELKRRKLLLKDAIARLQN